MLPAPTRVALGRRFHRLSRIARLVELPIELGPADRSTFHLVIAKRAVDVPRILAIVDVLPGALDPPAPRRRN
jgi:hypothetical protein